MTLGHMTDSFLYDMDGQLSYIFGVFDDAPLFCLTSVAFGCAPVFHAGVIRYMSSKHSCAYSGTHDVDEPYHAQAKSATFRQDLWSW